jgi:hypothetical protein
MLAPVRFAVHVVCAVVTALALSACADDPDVAGREEPAAAAPAGRVATPEGAGSQGEAAPAKAPQPVTPLPTIAPSPEPSSPDRIAGVLSREVAPVGSGGTVVVPGSAPAPGAGEERRVRVEIEGGLPLDGAAVAGFVMATLNDPRSWTAGGLTFSRTDGDADVVVVLASPQTSARMCLPLETGGTLSCREGPRAIITTYRWVGGMEDYGDDLTGYRQYVVNHEVGHVLGHGHESCPAAGQPAPVMQQQTKGVGPCLPNPWPYP